MAVESRTGERAFGVGCAKSGTHSLARMFEGVLRAEHEAAAETLMTLVLRRHGGAIPDSEFTEAVAALFHSLDLEFNVSQVNGLIIDTLYRLYPTARYVLTLREPGSWLRSFVNHQLTIQSAPGSAWHAFRELRFQPAAHPHRPEDAPLRDAALYGVDAYLAYWARHNLKVIDTIPAEQLLIAPTARITDDADRIEAFLGLPAGAALREKSHDYAGSYVRTPLDDLDDRYLEGRIDGYRRALMEAVRPRVTEAALAAIAQAIGVSQDYDGPPTDVTRWSDPSNLHERWSARSVAAAKHVPAGSTVLDIGCGKMVIEGLLPAGCRYIPVDVVARDERTVVCDLNKGERPPADGVTLVTVLGVLEYVNDPAAFWAWLQTIGRPVILSYVVSRPTFPVERRRAMGWVNHLEREALIDLAARHGHALTSEERISEDNTLFVFNPV